MAMWMTPAESLPDVECGDRVIGIVRCRLTAQEPLTARIVILEATESGWRDIEDAGYDLFDCELWTAENDLVKIADIISK